MGKCSIYVVVSLQVSDKLVTSNEKKIIMHLTTFDTGFLSVFSSQSRADIVYSEDLGGIELALRIDFLYCSYWRVAIVA